ncbi:MAG TPA: DUF6505 family protein [Candidatus Cybelea sp.]|nr:DUF6505 family protein [Candidatus Cybelea sp.]
MRLLRAIRLDPSDTFIFSAAAEPGEWAISGAFVFSEIDPAALKGPELAAFRSGFLGIPSLGWSTLVQVVEASAADRAAAIHALARCLLDRFGAPDFAAAQLAAAEEIDFAASLADHPPDTLIAVRRSDEDGTIREVFRTLRPREDKKGWRAFSFLDADAEEEPGEAVDLAALVRRTSQ